MIRALFLPAGVAFLLQIAAAGPRPCVPGTLASYIALGASGCGIGSVSFFNFRYQAKASGGAATIPADQIQVNPVLGVPATTTLSFTAAWQVGSTQTQDSIIDYRVTPSPVRRTGAITLQLGPATAGSFGDVEVREATSAGNLRVFTKCGEVACQSKSQDMRSFSPAGRLKVVQHVKLKALSTGSATLSAFTATVDFCPKCN